MTKRFVLFERYNGPPLPIETLEITADLGVAWFYAMRDQDTGTEMPDGFDIVIMRDIGRRIGCSIPDKYEAINLAAALAHAVDFAPLFRSADDVRDEMHDAIADRIGRALDEWEAAGAWVEGDRAWAR